MDADVQVGDEVQVWLDWVGYQGRIGRVIQIARNYHLLRLGDGEVIRLDLRNRKARISNPTAIRPLKYKVYKRPQKEKTQSSRFKRTTPV